MSNSELNAGAQPCTTTTTTTPAGFPACGTVFFEYLGFGLSVSLFQDSIRIHSHITDSLKI
jgi:hypothetical protein